MLRWCVEDSALRYTSAKWRSLVFASGSGFSPSNSQVHCRARVINRGLLNGLPGNFDILKRQMEEDRQSMYNTCKHDVDQQYRIHRMHHHGQSPFVCPRKSVAVQTERECRQAPTGQGPADADMVSALPPDQLKTQWSCSQSFCSSEFKNCQCTPRE